MVRIINTTKTQCYVKETIIYTKPDNRRYKKRPKQHNTHFFLKHRLHKSMKNYHTEEQSILKRQYTTYMIPGRPKDNQRGHKEDTNA